MDISVIVCTYNRCKELQAVLQSCNEMLVPDNVSWEIIVVDNNSTDETNAAVATFSQDSRMRVKYVFEGRQGKSYALNTGILASLGKIIAFTDDDATVDRNWIVELMKIFEKFNCTGVGGRIVPIWPADKPKWFETKLPYSSMAAIVYFDKGDKPLRIKGTLIGANMAFKRELFEKHGLFRTDLGPTDGNMGGGGEDSELCLRFCTEGEILMYTPSAIVYHPVEKRRATKSYFRAWAFRHGRALSRTKHVPVDAVRLLGVPRYYLQFFLDASFKWFFSVQLKKRFYHECKLWEVMGEMFELYRESKNGKMMDGSTLH